MAGKTIISWTDKTWNPVTGCHKVSEGCRYCYAERLSLERGWTRYPWTAANAPANVKMHPERLGQPRHWKEPARVFVNSMSDLFHEEVPEWFIDDVFRIMRTCPQHTFQVLTKRERISWGWDWPSNAWAGVSVEGRDTFFRVMHLLETSAKVKFISFEPLLGPIGEVDLEGIHWIIVGGESGPTHRPMDMAWARELRDQADDAGIPFFFKQDAGRYTEMRPWILEEDGSRTTIQEYPAVDARALQPGLF